MKLSRPAFRYVESELYNYDETKKELEELQEDIRNSTPDMSGDVVKVGKVSSQPEAKSIQLLTNKVLVRMDRTIKAIDKALSILGEEHNMIFELKYRQNLNWRQVVIEVPTSQDTYFRKRRELVQMVAVQLGLISPEQ